MVESEVRHDFVRVEELGPVQQTVVRGWLKGYAEQILVLRQIFTDKDGSTGRLHLVCSDLTCSYDAISMTYKKRWQVEVFHKSLKSSANLAKSPTRTLRTQSNHVFLAICAASSFRLEAPCRGQTRKRRRKQMTTAWGRYVKKELRKPAVKKSYSCKNPIRQVEGGHPQGRMVDDSQDVSAPARRRRLGSSYRRRHGPGSIHPACY
jgi:hypothetical protein